MIVIAAFAFVALCCGCVLPAYRYGRYKDSMCPATGAATNPLTYDPPHPKLDLLEKALFRPVDGIVNALGAGHADHRLREERMQESLATTLDYLGKNNLNEVYIDIRRYNPRAQWRRLRENNKVHPFWKYTAGSVTWAAESILPPRLFRYSYYNAYTNTLAMNSVWREWNISEAARAKDFLGARFPGTYAVAQHIPFVPIYQEVRIGTDALTYARAIGDRELELELYPYAYGEIFGSAVTEAAIVVPGLSGLPFYSSPLIWGSSFATGFGLGHLQKSRLELAEQFDQSGGTHDLIDYRIDHLNSGYLKNVQIQ